MRTRWRTVTVVLGVRLASEVFAFVVGGKSVQVLPPSTLYCQWFHVAYLRAPVRDRSACVVYLSAAVSDASACVVYLSAAVSDASARVVFPCCGV